jgi:hypothetical protein
MGVGLLLVPSVSLAAEFMKPSDDSGNIVLSTSETHKNLYTAGGNVTVNSETKGDLYAAGGVITVDGAIEQDGVVAGGTVFINSKVGGDVRVAGGTVTINADIAGDVVAAGGTLIISERAKIGGDLIMAGGTVTLSAPVSGRVLATGGQLTLDGAVTGAVMIKSARMVTFGPRANIAGAVTVTGEQEPIVREGAKVGNINYTRSMQAATAGHVARVLVVGSLVWVLASILTALVFAWLAPRRVENFVGMVHKKFLVNAAIGLAALVVTPIVVIALLFLLVGYQLAFLLLVSYVFALSVSWVLAVLWTGAQVYRLARKQTAVSMGWQVAVVGGLVFTLIRLIPVVGALACFVILMASFGGLLVQAKHSLVERHSEEK